MESDYLIKHEKIKSASKIIFPTNGFHALLIRFKKVQNLQFRQRRSALYLTPE